MSSKITIQKKTLFKSKESKDNKDIKDNTTEKNSNGVYQIYCKTTKKSYIGSSSNIEKRIKTHKQHLEKGCHNSRRLQKDYDTYGIKDFEFNILEKDIENNLLTAYEKYWIYKTDAIVMYKGYNDNFPTLNNDNFQYVCRLKGER